MKVIRIYHRKELVEELKRVIFREGTPKEILELLKEIPRKEKHYKDKTVEMIDTINTVIAIEFPGHDLKERMN